MKNKYRNDPIVEVILEIHFKDEALLPEIDQLKSTLAEDFPKYQKQLSYAVDLSINEDSLTTSQKLIDTHKHIFYTADEKTVLQLDKNSIFLNRLKPYCGWDKLTPYLDIIDNKILIPNSINMYKSLKLRYLNLFELPKNNAYDLLNKTFLENYFNFSPNYSFNEISEIYSFISGIEQKINMTDLLKTQIQTNQSGKEMFHGLTLDLSCYVNPFLVSSVEYNKGGARDWFENAHSIIIDNFEKIITKETRNILGCK